MENNNPVSYQPHSMKWHNFLIYFSLWLSMLFSVGYGLFIGFGMHYGGDGSAQLVYAYSGMLRVVDILYLLASLVMAVYTFKTRQKLANYKKDGPVWLVRLYILNLVVEVIYLVLVCVTVPELISFGDMLGDLMQPAITAVVMAYVNKTYYGKRAAIFQG